MPTEIKNTLFRFVTMRAPELLPIEAKEQNFIQLANPETDGYFADIINGSLVDAEDKSALISAFTPAATLDQLIPAPNDLLSLGSWLLKNRDNPGADKAFLDNFVYDREIENLSVIEIWDNLFYQLLTDEDAVLRDQISTALIGLHYFTHRELENANWNQKAKATIICPKGLFEGFANDAPAIESPVINTKNLQKYLSLALAKDKLGRLEVLRTELSEMKKAYDNQNADAYRVAKSEYEEDLTATIEANTDTDPVTQEIRTKLFYTTPFGFEPLQELDAAALLSGLSEQSFTLASELNFTAVTSFAAAESIINLEAQKQNGILFAGSNFTGKLANINNLLLPVDETGTSSGELNAFLLQAVEIGNRKYKFLLVINLGFANADAIDALYSANPSTGLVSSTVFKDYASGNNLVVELYPEGLVVPVGVSSFPLNGSISLSNGMSLLVDTDPSLTTLIKGRVTVTADTASSPVELYVPKGFGIRRLGIADYRKVEQTVCCYVPGEVSHIENIMAREYKERSSRRLRRSEDTTTTERQTEMESLTDTSSTERFDMQQQVSEVLNKDMQSSVSSTSSFKLGGMQMDLGANFASNTSQQKSNSQALTYAKDVTSRAMDRVVQKVREERVTRIIEEFEEQNKHGFDNRLGDGHVSGVYRWVDKIYKNQVENYGKRLMYEFMIPQPAVFHNEAMKTMAGQAIGTTLDKPVDPRVGTTEMPVIKTHKDITVHNYNFWAGVYNAEVSAPPIPLRYIGKSFSTKNPGQGDGILADSINDSIKIPEGYQAVSAKVQISGMNDGSYNHGKGFAAGVGNMEFNYLHTSTYNVKSGEYSLDKFVEEMPFAAFFCSFHTGQITATVRLELLAEYFEQWQIETFNAIIKSYQDKLNEYNTAIESITQTGSQATNPTFYRDIENMVLRKNCIGYLVGNNNLGKDYYTGTTVSDVRPTLTDDMDRYAALVKFIEQAFEWEIIGYTFYPFYWADKAKWQILYQKEVNDELFRSFLQSGMARVVVTVRPGFEEAVLHYMATGQVWSGGVVPVIGDDLYLSIVEELKNPVSVVEETWETRVPTALTVIQDGGIGLNEFSSAGLPCDCGDVYNGLFKSTNQIGQPNLVGGD